MATFGYYLSQVARYGYFQVRLDDNWGAVSVSDEACKQAAEKWLTPLLTSAEQTHIFQRLGGCIDVTPAPRTKRPVVINRTKSSFEIELSSVDVASQQRFWTWALRHRKIFIVIPLKRFPLESLATECWDPGILTNVSVAVGANTLAFARHQSQSARNLVCVFTTMGGSLYVELFSRYGVLARLFEGFVLHCRFLNKGLAKELMPYRRERTCPS